MKLHGIPTATRHGVIVLVIVLVMASGGVMCSSASSMAPDRTVAPGQWGGDHVTMDVTAKGATLEFDCAHARIDEAMTIDSSGRFDVRGTFTAERGGPVRETEDDRSRPARFTGRVIGKSMTLAITLASGGDSMGTFTLEQGKAGLIRKCL